MKNQIELIKEEGGKIWAMFFTILAFVVGGFEHCIADLYYFSMAGFTKDAWIRILIITLGNSVGSIVLHLAVNFEIHELEQEPPYNN